MTQLRQIKIQIRLEHVYLLECQPEVTWKSLHIKAAHVLKLKLVHLETIKVEMQFE